MSPLNRVRQVHGPNSKQQPLKITITKKKQTAMFEKGERNWLAVSNFCSRDALHCVPVLPALILQLSHMLQLPICHMCNRRERGPRNRRDARALTYLLCTWSCWTRKQLAAFFSHCSSGSSNSLAPAPSSQLRCWLRNYCSEKRKTKEVQLTGVLRPNPN